eukprot:TRINITY_DN18849_c0_g1_i1.p1 TRINITY_DN18849_c0_g1~~TRINITY_DN18849_c0_g1_i1.p1  ORF type:complete len:128 (-),score=29.81 TRINITY_DN18849_c0_g1_i1:126-509(-)
MFRINSRLAAIGRFSKDAGKGKGAAAAGAGKKKGGAKDAGSKEQTIAEDDHGFVFASGTKLDGLNFWNNGQDDPVLKDWADYPPWVADLAKETPNIMQQDVTPDNFRLYRRAVSRAAIRQHNSTSGK